jgi:putative ATP-binding cassette transporter
VTKENIKSYRQCISSIYTDYHLFERVLTPIDSDKEKEIKYYLQELALDNKVTLVGGVFSSLSLSDGQRKRLALLVAFLDDSELYVFDEWAADQDPYFKSVFYTQIIPQLKARNKAILVISHDEAYFDVADDVIKIENGKVKSDTDVKHKIQHSKTMRREETLSI